MTWTGAAVVWAVTGAIGVAAALWPAAWMALFTNDPAVQAAGGEYLRIVGGCYGFFGVGLVLFFASQGAGRLGWALGASAARLLVVAIGGWFTVHVVAGPPAALYAIIALSLVALAGVVAVATYAADWAVAARVPDLGMMSILKRKTRVVAAHSAGGRVLSWVNGRDACKPASVLAFGGLRFRQAPRHHRIFPCR